MKTIKLKSKCVRRVDSGHQWIFSNEITDDLKYFSAGETVAICDSHGRFLGKGYINPKSLITIRLLTKNEREEIDQVFFTRKIDEARKYRERVLEDTNACRIIYSEGDYLPGLIADKYNDVITLQVLTAGIEKNLELIIEGFKNVYRPKAIILRNESRYRELEGLELYKKVVFGGLSDAVIIEENGVKFEVDVLEGQKTGFFFDQRDNRLILREFAKGKRVLDCYSYVGGFALNAALSEAKEVIGIDSSEYAVKLAKRNADHNNLKNVRFVEADAREELVNLAQKNEKFDMVILDPPSLVKNRKGIFQAIRLYKELNSNAMKILKPNGILVTASCSQLLSWSDFQEMIGDASKTAERRVRIIKKGFQAPDHPIIPQMPETEYLKCLFLEVG